MIVAESMMRFRSSFIHRFQVDWTDSEWWQVAREETWKVMEEYSRAGKIRALGISNHCALSPPYMRRYM